MLDLARSDEPVPILPDQLDRDPMLLNVRNGTLDLRTGELRPHSGGDYLTRLAPVTYEPAADCPTWRGFLDSVFAGDAEIIVFVQRLIGLCLTGDVSEHLFTVFWGSGANGKSTLGN